MVHFLLGKTVIYTITADDAAAMNQRRPHPLAEVSEGEVYPMMIMAVVGGDPNGLDASAAVVNGMVFPDGWDLHRVVGVKAGSGPGTFALN